MFVSHELKYLHATINNMATVTKVILALFAATCIATVAQATPPWFPHRPRPLQTSMQLSAPTPCQDAGYVGGCCNLAVHTTCFIPIANCHCDLSCELYGDCCSDMGCATAPGETGTCADLPDLPNGRIVYTPLPDSKRPGTIAHHICDNNYELVGRSIQVCQVNLTWDGSQPKCRETCAALPAPEHGQVAYEPTTSTFESPRKPNRTVAIYSCDEGYFMSSNEVKTRICVQPGTSDEWSGRNVACLAHSCRAAFPGSGGCCDSSQSASCDIGFDEFSCSCSVDCFSADSSRPCCPDIGCVPRTCAEAGLSSGCCQWSDSGCYVPGGECYCDEECVELGNCCQDVTTPLDCPSIVSPILTAQSVRTKPYSQAQVVSRFREGQIQDNQAVRELASELRLMSQEQELSTKQLQAQWKIIMKELQEIQKDN